MAGSESRGRGGWRPSRAAAAAAAPGGRAPRLRRQREAWRRGEATGRTQASSSPGASGASAAEAASGSGARTRARDGSGLSPEGPSPGHAAHLPRSLHRWAPALPPGPRRTPEAGRSG